MNAKSSKTGEEQSRPTGRSPSPSAVSTASSASPLIRANSTSSSSSASSQRSNGGASSPHHQQARRPAPTSIAAAQLQQQLARQQESGHKPAHMSRDQLQAGHKQQVNYRLQDEQQQHNCKLKSKLDGAHSSQGLGYKLGKTIAHRASRFNEFWSVNKMRYMNLACLLMTLVCLLTILLFSKSNVSEGQPKREIQAKRLRAPKWTYSQAASQSRLDGHTLHDDQEPPFESMDQVERQPLVVGAWRRRSVADLDADSAVLEDSKHEPRDRPSGSFEDIVQDARRQLKRQQESEREAEETSTSSSSSANSSGATESAGDGSKSPSSLSEPNLSQIFDDLDSFGLFKAIKSQLVQANLSQARPTIVRTSPHGATIIMSLSGNSSGTAIPTGSLLEKLLPPIFRPPSSLPLDDNPDAKPGPRGFATVTIRSEPLIRGPFMQSWPFPASPLGAFGMRPSESLVNPFVSTTHSMAPPGGLFGALLRATGELMADQMAQLEAANKTDPATSNSTNKDTLSQQASHKATIVRLPLATGANSTGSGNSSASDESLDDEVETFDVGQMAAPRMAPAPFAFVRSPISPLMRSLFAGSRSRAGPLIISSRSGAPEMMFEPPPLGADFGSDSAPSAFSVLPSSPFAPSLMMPRMLMFGSSGGQPAAPSMVRALMAASKQMEQREKESTSSSARRDDQEQNSPDSEGWDEQFSSGPAGKSVARHRSVSDSSEDETPDQAPFFASVSSGASSVIENMLASGKSGAPVGRVSGSIKQIFRAPGVTVERMIELPLATQQPLKSPLAGDDRAQVQAVASGVRSQSISRLDEDSPDDDQKAAPSQRVANLAEQRRVDVAELGREFVRPLGMSRTPVGGFITRLFSDLNRHDEPGESFEGSLPSLHPLGSFLSGASSIFGPLPAVAKSQRQQRAFSERSMAEDESDSDAQDQDEQQDSDASRPLWSPGIRLNSARIRVSPMKHDGPLPARFSIPAEPPVRQDVDRLEARLGAQDNSRLVRAMKPAPIRSINEHQDSRPDSALSSPNSALFGFPAMKATAPTTSSKPQPRASETSSRPFVYHSNHEVAGSMGRSMESREQQPHLAGSESRSTYQHRSSTGAQSVAGVPAAIGMGRRLDEGELIN